MRTAATTPILKHAAGSSPRPDTRTRIQSVALGKFTQFGYDQTSLREIAEALGITKAAIYYHFTTKEDILVSLLDQAVDEIDALIDWMESEPSTRERRLEMIERLTTLAAGPSGDIVRCLQLNEVALQRLGPATGLINDMKSRLTASAAPAHATVEARLRVWIAVTAVFTATRADSDLGGTADDRAAAARDVAGALMP